MSGCSAPAPTPDDSHPEDAADRDAAAQPDKAELDRLRSLGYLGSVPAGEDAGGDGVTRRDPSASYPGLDLVTVRNQCTTLLVDEAGATVHQWRMKPCGYWSNPELLLPSGDLVVPGSDPGDFSDAQQRRRLLYLARLSWDGDVIWKRVIHAHHDVSQTPSGDLLTLVADHRSVPALDAELPVLDDRISLVSPDGEVLESQSLFDVLSSARPPFEIERIEGKGELDLFHSNAVQWLGAFPRSPHPEHPHVLVCVRHQNVVAVIDWTTRELVWSWGRGELLGPHAATALPDGHVLIFDNGMGRRWSRVVELDPRSETIVWQYAAQEKRDFYSLSRGSNQRLPNGNTLISESDKGHGFEVTRDGRIVWEYWNPLLNGERERATIIRIQRFDRARLAALLATDLRHAEAGGQPQRSPPPPR